MTQSVLAGLCAGVASALLFASAASGLGVAIVLLCLAPLPVMIAAMGWSQRAGAIAAVAGAALLMVVVTPEFAAVFLLFAGFPGWILGFAALLGRPVGGANGAAPAIEWYPPGRLLAWAAVFGAAGLALSLLALEGDEAALRQDLRSLAEVFLHPPEVPGLPPMPPEVSAIDPELMVTVLMRSVLPLTAVLMSSALAVDLWIAGHVVRISQRLSRPWPDLADVTLPPVAAVLWVAALAGAFVIPDLPGIAAGLLAATLTTAFAVAGFALLHAVTRGMPTRLWILGSAYLAVALLGVPLVLMTALGLADTTLGLRRFIKPGAKIPPPDIPPPDTPPSGLHGTRN